MRGPNPLLARSLAYKTVQHQTERPRHEPFFTKFICIAPFISPRALITSPRPRQQNQTATPSVPSKNAAHQFSLHRCPRHSHHGQRPARRSGREYSREASKARLLILQRHRLDLQLLQGSEPLGRLRFVSLQMHHSVHKTAKEALAGKLTITHDSDRWTRLQRPGVVCASR